ncbi:MAG: hypothetical protein AAFR20_02975 [Pseudomonadota bacterium]
MLHHVFEWLGLVVPALLTVVAAAWVWRGWLGAGWLKFLGGYLGGLITLGVGAVGITLVTAKVLATQRETCAAGERPWTCYEIEIANAYPVLIGIISVGMFLVLIPVLKGLAAIYPPLARITNGRAHG